MSLSINVSLSQKASLDPKSTVYSINITADLDESLLTRPKELHERITGLYAQAARCIEQGTYLLNNEPTDHVDAAVRMTMRLRDQLQSLVGEVPWIQSVLAVPFAFVAFAPKQRVVWVLNEDNLVQHFEEAPKRLEKADVARFARAIERIQQNGAAMYGKTRSVSTNS